MSKLLALVALLLTTVISSHAYAAGCKGYPMQCNFFKSNFACGQQSGCSWHASRDECRGQPTSCSVLNNPTSCSRQRGCNWQSSVIEDINDADQLFKKQN